MDYFGRRLDQAQLRDQFRAVLEPSELLERPVEPQSVATGQAVGVVFDTQASAAKSHLAEKVAKRIDGASIVAIDPDANVLDDRGVLSLTQVGRARDQCHLAIGREY